MKRGIIIVLVLFLLGILAGVFLALRQAPRPEKIQPTATPTPAVIAPPSFPAPPYNTQPSYRVTTTASFPTKISSYKISGAPALRTVASDLAVKFGFAGTPKPLTGSRGVFYLWTQGQQTLVVGGDPVEVAYTTGAAPAGPIEKKADELAFWAEPWLEKLNLKNITPSLKYAGVDFFSPPAAGNLPPTVAVLNYQYEIDGLPLYAREPGVPSVSLQFNAKGDLVLLRAFLFTDVIREESEIPVLSLGKAAEELTSKEGVLTGVAWKTAVHSDVAPEQPPAAVSVSVAILAYYYSPGQARLVPIFVFEGEGKESASGKSIKTTTLLWAQANP